MDWNGTIVRMKNALIVVGIGAIILVGGWWYLSEQKVTAVNTHTETPANTKVPQPQTKTPTVAEQQGASGGADNTANFKCDGGKTMTVVFTNNLAGITLSDGRHMTLYQATSGSGIRYLTNDQKIELSGKGSATLLTENGKTTYASCVTN